MFDLIVVLSCIRPSVASPRQIWHTTLEMVQFARFNINNVFLCPERGGRTPLTTPGSVNADSRYTQGLLLVYPSRHPFVTPFPAPRFYNNPITDVDNIGKLIVQSGDIESMSNMWFICWIYFELLEPYIYTEGCICLRSYCCVPA
jgi:hypothetical protein